jgi:hypothetical protein
MQRFAEQQPGTMSSLMQPSDCNHVAQIGCRSLALPQIKRKKPQGCSLELGSCLLPSSSPYFWLRLSWQNARATARVPHLAVLSFECFPRSGFSIDLSQSLTTGNFGWVGHVVLQLVECRSSMRKTGCHEPEDERLTKRMSPDVAPSSCAARGQLEWRKLFFAAGRRDFLLVWRCAGRNLAN